MYHTIQSDIHYTAKYSKMSVFGFRKTDWKLWQQIWANAHETCDMISLISYAICLGLSRQNSLLKRETKITKNSLKTCHFSISRSYKVIDVGTPRKVVNQTRDSKLSYGKNPERLVRRTTSSHWLELVPGNDRQTDSLSHAQKLKSRFRR